MEFHIFTIYNWFVKCNLYDVLILLFLTLGIVLFFMYSKEQIIWCGGTGGKKNPNSFLSGPACKIICSWCNLVLPAWCSNILFLDCSQKDPSYNWKFK